MRALRLAWRQLRRDFVAGEVRILFAALVLAVTAVTAVGFLTDRAERALALEANRLLGGDALVRADEPIDGAIRVAANAPGLRSAETRAFPSMVRAGERLRLGEIRALGAGYPLRGAFRIVIDERAKEAAAASVPAPGTLWLSRPGAQALGVRIGDVLKLGTAEFRLAALVTQEPDSALDYFNVAPRVFLNLDDLTGTGLVQEGSRIAYRLVVAGEAAAVERFVATAGAGLGRGQRLETVADARPEIRSALDRADRFLGLAALVAVVLAAVAVAMAARRHAAHHLDACAVLRCLGASQRTVLAIQLGELTLLGLAGCAAGVALAWALQAALGAWLGEVLGLAIPPAGWLPVVQGFATGLVVLLAFGAPPVLALRRVPALRVLRRDLDVAEPSAWAVALAGLGGLAALLWWRAGSAELAGAMLAGIGATLAVLALLGMALILLMRVLRTRLRGPWRYGLANVGRRAAASVAQVAALGLGLMAILLLTLVRSDLLARWQLSLSADAPNRFVVNVQPDQVDPFADFLARNGLAEPVLYPMIRGRLTAVNGAAVTGDSYAANGERARRLAEREFNLSWATALRAGDNDVVAGRMWLEQGPATPELSVEEGLAQTLGWSLGDRIAFDIAGRPFEATITSLREVDWESFQPNFFVLASPGALDGYAASYITAFHLPAERAPLVGELVERFPNLSVIDVDAVLAQVRATADQVSKAVEVVFYFTLAAGLLVLLAAVSASQDERLLEGGVMRVLGASRRQLRLAQASEFAAIGLIAGGVAAIAAGTLAAVLAERVFDLPWAPDWRLAFVGGGLGLVAALVAGLWATRRVLDVPPAITLRELQT